MNVMEAKVNVMEAKESMMEVKVNVMEVVFHQNYAHSKYFLKHSNHYF